MNRGIKIVSGGSGHDTTFTDLETGKPLSIPIERVSLDITLDKVNTRLDVCHSEIDHTQENPGYYMHISNDKVPYRRISKITFEDGSELSFDGLNVK